LLEIRVKYNKLYPDYSGYNCYCGVEIGVVNEKDEYYPFFYDNLLADRKIRININDLLTESVLKEKNIDYYVDKSTKQIIPVGLVDFLKECGRKKLELFIENRDKLYMIDWVIPSIVTAIKVKYRALEIYEKCDNNVVEVLD